MGALPTRMVLLKPDDSLLYIIHNTVSDFHAEDHSIREQRRQVDCCSCLLVLKNKQNTRTLIAGTCESTKAAPNVGDLDTHRSKLFPRKCAIELGPVEFGWRDRATQPTVNWAISHSVG